MALEKEQEDLLARMVEGARDVPRADRKWLLMKTGRGGLFSGPGMRGREPGLDVDVHMLERQGLIDPMAYSARDANPTYVLTPEAFDYYAQTRESAPHARQESELRRFLDAQAFRSDYPEVFAKWSEADDLLWRADSNREFTTIGHKVREALQEFASDAIAKYDPPSPEQNPALVNKRIGAIIAKFLPVLGETRAAHLTALGNYSEATLGIVQRQEHGAQKEGDDLRWQDARRVVFHGASVMYEFAESFRDAASRS